MTYLFNIVDGPLAGQTVEIYKPDNQGWHLHARWAYWEYKDRKITSHYYKTNPDKMEMKFLFTRVKKVGKDRVKMFES